MRVSQHAVHLRGAKGGGKRCQGEGKKGGKGGKGGRRKSASEVSESRRQTVHAAKTSERMPRSEGGERMYRGQLNTNVSWEFRWVGEQLM